MDSITPQGREIEKLLLKKGALTAKEIASKLDIFPNAVYRSVNPLVNFGFVNKGGKYPIVYSANSPGSGIGIYTEAVKKELENSFSDSTAVLAPKSGLGITFIQDRSELIKKSDRDIARAKKDVCVIVSGLEVPAETTLAFKTAVDNEANVRVIVQNLDEAKKERLEHWKRLGMNIRHYSVIKARIIIVDALVVYLTSYNPSQKEEGVGVRFAYAPVATIMQRFFNQEWGKSKEL